MKPNLQFKLSVRDVEIIEHALRAKAGRRGLAIAQGETSPQLREEMNEIQGVLGRLHEQKNFELLINSFNRSKTKESA